MMIEKQIIDTYEKLRLDFYRLVFTHVRERDESLSAMEVFSLEVIYALGRPTISEFARCIGISQSNATYKVNSLLRKGYLLRLPSDADGREYHLELSKKFYSYSDIFEHNMREVTAKVVAELNDEEKQAVSKAVGIVSRELERIITR